MRGLLSIGWLVALVLSVLEPASAQDLSGRYVDVAAPGMTLVLEESADGYVTGSLSEAGVAMDLAARRAGAGFEGLLSAGGMSLAVMAALQDDGLLLEFGTGTESEQRLFRRTEPTVNAAASAGERRVSINGQPLDAAELKRIEAAYGIRIDAADYWYDPLLGAWGIRGGATAGFIAPGLALGGPLAADASGGGTQVFVNGRELPPRDYLALQQLAGPIAPGRYFITAQGLAGYEGGPPLWDLGAMLAQRGGGSTSWQSRLSSGISDGETIGVFLPNGGIVSTGP
jgi:hypothetical protein